MVYYALNYRLDHGDGFLLWYSADADGVVIDEAGQVLSFDTLSHLQEWASLQGWEVKPETPVLHDLDALEVWIANPLPDKIDCVTLLNDWNLFVDLSHSLGYGRLFEGGTANNDLYDKLFFGSNLPSVTPAGKRYDPVWSGKELLRLSQLFASGMSLFRANVKPFLRA